MLLEYHGERRGVSDDERGLDDGGAWNQAPLPLWNLGWG